MNLLETLWKLAVSRSLSATALILCVLLLRLALRGRVPAQCFHVLWLLVALRLLVPAPASGWSIFNLLEFSRGATASGADARWRVRTLERSAAVAPIASTRPPTAAPAPLREARSVIPALWFAGALWQVLRLAGAASRMGTQLRDARPVEDARVLSLIADCAQQLRLRRPPRVLETAALPGPAVLGLWRPRLLLPSGLTARLSEEELRFVVLHECAHLRRHDLAALWLLAAARVVHWFNPLVWLAARVARLDAELACDETVLRVTSARSPAPYGAALLRLAQVAAWRNSVLPAAGIVDDGRALRTRVLNISRYAPGRPVQSWLAALLVLGVTFVFGADEKIASTPAPDRDPASAASAGPATPTVETRGPGQPFRNDLQIDIEARFIELNATLARRLKLNTTDVQVRDRAELNRLVDAIGGRGSDVNVLNAERHEDLVKIINGIGGGTDVFNAPRVMTHSGQRAVIEIIREFRYPTEWDPATVVDGVKGPIIPKAFEMRNCGVTLEVEPTYNDDGSVALILRPQVVEFLGFLDLETGKGHPVRRKGKGLLRDRTVNPSNPIFPVGAPGHPLKCIFSTRKLETDVTLMPGDSVLLTGAREVEETTPFASPERARRLVIIVTARVVDSQGMETKVTSRPAGAAAIVNAGPAPAIASRLLDLGIASKPIGFEWPTLPPIESKSTNALGITEAETINPMPAPSITPPAKAATPERLPPGTPVPGKPGFVRSPYAPDPGYIDVRGFPPGTEVKDPYSGKIFLVP